MSKINEMMAILQSHGHAFMAASAKETRDRIAREWLEYFDPDDADAWMTVGFWEPSVAHRVSQDMTPEQANERSVELREIDETLDAIYALCNGDLDWDLWHIS